MRAFVWVQPVEPRPAAGQRWALSADAQCRAGRVVVIGVIGQPRVEQAASGSSGVWAAMVVSSSAMGLMTAQCALRAGHRLVRHSLSVSLGVSHCDSVLLSSLATEMRWTPLLVELASDYAASADHAAWILVEHLANTTALGSINVVGALAFPRCARIGLNHHLASTLLEPTIWKLLVRLPFTSGNRLPHCTFDLCSFQMRFQIHTAHVGFVIVGRPESD